CSAGAGETRFRYYCNSSPEAGHRRIQGFAYNWVSSSRAEIKHFCSKALDPGGYTGEAETPCLVPGCCSGVDTKQRKAYIRGMEMMPIKPERKAQLDDYAQRHGQAPVDALDEVLADALEWEQQDYREAVEGIRQGYADFKAGRTQPAEEVFEELRVKHG